MSEDADHLRREAEKLLTQAAAAANMNERSRLIDQAASFHTRALIAAGLQRLNDGAQDDEASEL